MRRQLTKVEKDLNNKAIERFKKTNLTLLTYLIPKYELELKAGLELEYIEKRKMFEGKLSEFKSEVESNKRQIDILTEQNEKGVEPKIK